MQARCGSNVCSLLRSNTLAINTPAGAASAKASNDAMTRPMIAVNPIHRMRIEQDLPSPPYHLRLYNVVRKQYLAGNCHTRRLWLSHRSNMLQWFHMDYRNLTNHLSNLVCIDV
jgi:hypothetical protein